MASAFVSLTLIFLSLVGGGFLLMVLSFWTRAHRLVVRVPTGRDNWQIEATYLMVPRKSKEDGTVWWHSAPWQKKIRLPEPPGQSSDMTHKGKRWVEVVKLSEDEFVYLRCGQLKKGDRVEKDNKLMEEAFKPFSVVQRETIINQFKKSEAGRPTNWLKDNAMNLSALVMMTMIIIIGMIYWGDIAKYTLEKDAASSGILKDIRVIVGDLKEGAQSVTPETAPSGGIITQGEEPPR